MFISGFLAALLAACAPGRAAASPHSLLAATMIPPASAYRATIEVSAGDPGRTKIIEVSASLQGGVRREIVDRFGIPLVTIISDGETEWVYDRAAAVAWKGEPADADLKLMDPDEEMELLLENYSVRGAGDGSAAGRPCRRIEIATRGENPRPLRRLCIEESSGLVLERLTFDGSGRESGSLRFLRLEMPASIPESRFQFRPPAGVRVRESRLRPDYMALKEAAAATALTPRIPRWVPNGFVFESVNLLAYGGATVLHYRYSDGIDALSVFQGPPRTRLRFSGDAPSSPALGGGGEISLFSGGKMLVWSAGDAFVVIGNLSVESLRRIADSVPDAKEARGDFAEGFMEIDAFPEENLP